MRPNYPKWFPYMMIILLIVAIFISIKNISYLYARSKSNIEPQQTQYEIALKRQAELNERLYISELARKELSENGYTDRYYALNDELWRLRGYEEYMYDFDGPPMDYHEEEDLWTQEECMEAA